MRRAAAARAGRRPGPSPPAAEHGDSLGRARLATTAAPPPPPLLQPSGLAEFVVLLRKHFVPLSAGASLVSVAGVIGYEEAGTIKDNQTKMAELKTLLAETKTPPVSAYCFNILEADSSGVPGDELPRITAAEEHRSLQLLRLIAASQIAAEAEELGGGLCGGLLKPAV